MAAFYRPARTVGGDFYDFIPLPDGRVMFVVGDVTDKGMPAALVMASTHALLRGAAPRLIAPGAVLAHVNDLLCADIPAHMFVTCLALVLDPLSGKVEFANAGHDVPYVRTADGVAELRARGMPLGLMPGMEYEEKTFQFQPGDCVLLHSDGLAEAHAPDREMFGFPRVGRPGRPRAVRRGTDRPVPHRARRVHRAGRRAGGRHHPGDAWSGLCPPCTREAADDLPGPAGSAAARGVRRWPASQATSAWRLARVAEAVAASGLAPARLERLKTAVAEATMNAIEHGNRGRPEIPVDVEVTQDGDDIIVAITDLGGEHEPPGPVEEPDLELKLDGEQRARGWGLFLIRNMVDAMEVRTDGPRHTVRLTMRAGGGPPVPHTGGHEGDGDEEDV